MIDNPEILDVPAQATALIRLTIPREEIGQVMGPALQELMAAVKEQGVGPTGPWFCHHLRMVPDIFDFECSVPVSAPVAPTGRVQAGERPAATVARTVYHGGYEGLGDGWSQLMDWIDASGNKPGPSLWEVYVVGPDSGLPEAQWQTELNRPLEN